ncbi:MAG: OmpA family protein [Bacteroidota bacterium]|nr:OmpA family protein [Bacteroidota bacterium]MDP3144223.1 OmpA family protein [Bacteroidota bacterium]
MNKATLLFLILSTTTLLKSQSNKEKIADKYFANLEYLPASKMYEELAKSKHAKIKYYVRAGESNLNIGNYSKAQKYYENAYANTGMSDKDFYNYYQVLKYNSNYNKASEVFSKISNDQYKLIRSNINRKNFAIEELKKDSGNYSLKRLTINSEENDFCSYLLNNQMYFLSSRRNTSFVGRKYGWDNSYYLDVYMGDIEGTDVKKCQVVKEGLKTKAHEGPICFTDDGNIQFITRDNLVNNKLKKSSENQVNLKILVRKKENNNWGAWFEFPFNSNEYSCGHPAVSGDGNTLYFVSDMPGSFGLTDIWVSHYKNNNWSKPENLGKSVNSEGREMFPHLFNNEVLFYSSDGKVGLGGLDIFYTMPTGNDYFEAQNLGYPINSQFDDFGFLAKTTTQGYFASNRGETKDDIYSFESINPIIGGSINLVVKDNITKKYIPNTKIVLIAENSKSIYKGVTDDKGEIRFNVLDDKGYKIAANKDGYKEGIEIIKGGGLKVLINSKKEVFIESMIFGLIGSISDAENALPIDGVKVTITDGFNQTQPLTFTTDKEGGFKHTYKDKKIGDELSYVIKLEKEGYLTKIQPVDMVIKKDGYIVLNDYLNNKMCKMKLGTDIGKAVDLKPIYFDLDKSTVRMDAKLELDKIVQLLKQNPEIVIELSSHTDCRGTATRNLALSDRRAKASAGYIISKGISQSRIYGKGYGESKLINDCKCENMINIPCSEEQHAQNRRTEFKITKIKP